MAVCTMCRGAKAIHVPLRWPVEDDETVEYVWERCSGCDGTGELKAERMAFLEEMATPPEPEES